MIIVPCPNCGPRNSGDLRPAGEVIERNTATNEIRGQEAS